MRLPERNGTGIRLFPVAFLLALALPGLARARQDVQAPETFGRGPSSVYAIREPNIFTHNVGLLSLQITNIGIIGNPFIDDLSAGWRGGEYLFLAGLWVGAIGEDAEPHVSTAVPVELRPALLPIDTIYESFEGIRGGARPGFFNGDDDGDNLLDEDFHNGKDDDGDGQIDEDYASIGQQMYSCEYRDDTPEATNQLNEHVPLGLRIEQRSFQWATEGINEFVGFDFRIINVGDQRLRNMYIGFNTDADAGPKTFPQYWTDDLVGYVRVDTVVTNSQKSGQCAREMISMDIAYIWDAPDNGTTIQGGDVPGYFGGMFLGHTTDPSGTRAPVRVGLATVRWTSSSGAYPQGDPRTDFERYDLLSRGQIPTRNASKPDDYRFTLAAGPFSELNPGEELTFQTAFVIGEGLPGMIQNAIDAQRVFNGQYVDADQNVMTGVEGRELCLAVLDERAREIMWDDPCDTLMTTRSFTQRFCDPTGANFVDDDCDPCTGIEGKEELLNWVGTTAPPPPNLNTDPALMEDRLAQPGFELFVTPPGRDRRVVLQWDNASELRPDPITGKNLFEGYRVWRVDNWQRPEGSIGPTPSEWMLLAEFRRNPRDGKGVLSPRHLRSVTRFDRGDDANEIKEQTPFGPQFYIGRYEWPDTAGVTNGKVYFYAVTAFGVDTRINASTGFPESIELGGSPAAVQRELVVASWQPGTSCSDIKVVPNPYRGGADWDLMPSDCDPTGTKIAFRNLPEGWERINIYTLAGDLVLSADQELSRVVGNCEISQGNRQDGTFYWDLITRSGQNVVAGVYLYVVETGNELCRGRFVIIR
jgi:hypothetical protein